METTSYKNFEKKLKLYHFTLENLHEAVLWINSEGKIFQANEMASKMSGYTNGELCSMSITQLNPTQRISNFPAYWEGLKKEKKLVFESEHRHKTGYAYDVEISANYIEFENEEISCSVVRDIRKRKLEEELLRVISEATAGLTGKDFFIELAKHITVTLSMRYALITECANEEKTRLRTICYIDGRKILDNIEYDTRGIPCEIIMQGKDFFMARGVEEYFPKEKGIQSYVGVPIYSPSTGEVTGHIIAVDPNPVSSEKNQTAI
jgi:PAS domain S-box-containing protein